MDNQDKIFDKIKNAAHKAEEKDFPGMDRIWQRVDAKLEQKELQTKTQTWKKIAIAASVVLLISLGYQFLKTDSKITAPSEIQQDKVVIEEKQEAKIPEETSENIKSDVAVILKKQIEKQAAVTMASENNSTETVSSADAIPIDAVLKDKSSEETAVNSPKKEAFISEEKKSDLTGASVAIISAKDLEKIPSTSVSEALKGHISEIPTTSPENLSETKAIALKEKKSKAKVTTSYDAEKRIISGIITDESNLAIPGANVFIKGTKNAVATDFDGKFSIQAEKGDQLVFSYIGYKTSYAAVGESDRMNMKLTNDSMALNEVVVVGYGTQRKSDLTGAVAMVSDADLKKSRAKAEKNTEAAKTKREKETILKNKRNTFRNQIFDAIVVKSAYEKTERTDSIITKKTAETNGPLVVVNGKATKAQYNSVQEAKKAMPKKLNDQELESVIILNEPLYIINGVEYTEESLFGSHPTSPYAPLSKQIIETIEIFQDQEAIEKFGKKGSKGVVIITTKNKVPSQK